MKLKLLLLVIMMTAVSAANAATVVWMGGTYGNWDNAANWSSNPLLPGAGDIVFIDTAAPGTVRHWIGSHRIDTLKCYETLDFTGGDLFINSPSFCANLNLLGGYLWGYDKLELTGTSKWGIGTVANDMGIWNASTGTLSIFGDGFKNLSSALWNYGKIIHTGQIDVDVNGYINNCTGATYDIQADSDIMCISGVGNFYNDGTLKKSVTLGESDIYVPVRNNGTITSDAGILRLMAGGIANSGKFTAAGDASVILDNDIYTMKGACSAGGTGSMSLGSGGTLLMDGSSNLSCSFDKSFKIAGGTVTGIGALINKKNMEWNGGALWGANNVSNESNMTISGSTTKLMRNSNFINKGTITHQGKGSIEMGQNSWFANLTGSTYILRTDSDLLCPDAAATFHNLGTLRKEYSYDVSVIEPYFRNEGYVDVQTGTLSLRGGGMFHDCGVQVAHLASLAIEKGDYPVYSTFQVGGSGSALLSGGTMSFDYGATATFGLETGLKLSGTNISGEGNLINTWAMNWSGGSVSNLTHFINQGTMTVSGDTDKKILNAFLYNPKDIIQTGLGNLSIDATSTVTNQNLSTYTFKSDAGITGTGTVTNGGKFSKQYSFGVSKIEPKFINNNGSFDIQTGTISLLGGGTFYDGGAHISHLCDLTFAAGNYSMNGTFTSSGDGSATLSGGTMNMAAGSQTRFGLTTGLHIAGITTTGPGSLYNTLNADWSTGTIGDASIFENSGTLSIINSDTKYMQGSKLDSTGTILYTGTGAIDFKNQATLNNRGTYTIRTDADFTCADGGSVFLNNGRFTKDYSNGITNFQTAFNNRGLIEVSSGTVRLSGGGSFIDGAATVGGPRVLDFAGGNFDLTGTFPVNGEGSVYFTGGTLTLNPGARTKINASGGLLFDGGTLTGTGVLQNYATSTWTRGSVAEGGTLENQATLSISGTAEKVLAKGTLLNFSQVAQTGTLAMKAGTLDLAHGVYDIQNDCSITGDGNINNTGLLIKSGGKDATIIEPILNNINTVEVSAGSLVFRYPSAQMVKGSLTGGKWIIRDDCTLDMGRDTPITTNAAEVTLVGASRFPQLDALAVNSGILHILNGHERVTCGELTNTGEIDFGDAVLLSEKNINAGNWHGAGYIRGGLSNRGILKPVAGIGDFRIAGTFSQTTAGTLQIELAGKATGQIGAISTSGNASLAGTLEITLANGFVPQRGDSFRIITSKARSGKFTTITGQTLPNGLTLNPVYTSNGVILVAGDPLPALTELASVGAVRQQATSAWVSVPGVVSAVFSDAFFIEDANRAAGIRVTSAQTPPAVGQVVQVAGQIGSGDMCLTLKTAQWAPLSTTTQAVKPLFINGRNLGGAACGLQGGVTGASSLNNVGMLVRVTGKITYLSSGSFAYIDDGSGLNDGNALIRLRFSAPGLRVILSPTVNIPTGAKWVTVTGICYRQTIKLLPQRAILVTSVDSVTY